MSELEWMEIFGDNLISLLEDARMTQKELAEESGLSEASISAYIKKTKLPGARAIVNIAYALDCSMDDLIDFGSRID